MCWPKKNGIIEIGRTRRKGSVTKKNWNMSVMYERGVTMREKKLNKGLVILIIVVSIPFLLLAMEVAGVIIKIVAPDSGFAQFIDSILNWIIRRFIEA